MSHIANDVWLNNLKDYRAEKEEARKKQNSELLKKGDPELVETIMDNYKNYGLPKN